MPIDLALPPLPEGRLSRAAIRARLRLIEELARSRRRAGATTGAGLTAA